jgi:aspartate carbamoyltransferase catalytic subunit
MFKDLISMMELSKQEIEMILRGTAYMETMPPGQKAQIMRHKTAALLFFEPSTRTRMSFEAAVQNLGGRTIGWADAEASSITKGESLIDTIKTMECYSDIIVLRHPLMGSARLAAEVSSKPVVNAGDGANQHPTQTLLDLYTILKAFTYIDGLRIGFVGDLKYGRTVHSLALALTHFKVELVFISPSQLKLPRYILRKVKANNIAYEDEILTAWLDKLDLLYATRIQKERFDPLEYEKLKDAYRIELGMLKDVKPTFKIMHPLPRVGEIAYNVDRTPHALYFTQLACGIPVREAVLSLLVGQAPWL